ncbi:MAG TPA: sn-glycerol-3-phosphate ABC transporter ATP-binding protein UgpC [Acidimicrobiia bacterium]|nr:sn-glycerol-3-phosphate ABC transporter ATP-binding protein UgpC [Acidimicrobiia bacterium]HZQ78065.1 sn-glycerol-3-phosphate ABC transporter ATP-binding protein UgpC [Acidimicrobiia bacterium]
MAEIVLSGVTKAFPGGAVAVSSLDLEVADGEFLVLVGPSGSGKTTVLRMVGGLEEATAGEIRIGGRDVTHLAPRERDIAMVFQTYALYPHMTVFQNMAFGLKLRKTPGAEVRRRVEETAALLGLSDLLDRKPRQLSGGQRQRVAMGRAIVREPAAFLMDEPLSNLDAKLRVQMRAEITRLHHRLRTTTLYVTHDQTEAITMADRVAVMRDGTLQQLDAPAVLYDDPVNRFVAGFIGSPAMNVVTARLAAADGGTRVVASFGGHRLVVPEAVLARRPGAGAVVAGGGDVALGVRPEDIEDAEFVPGAGPDELLEVTVDLAEPLGAETIVHFDAAPGAPFTARLSPRSTVRAGRPVKLAVDVERLHLFDPVSGLSLR